MAVGYTPIFRILKGGNDISGNFNDRGLSISVEHNNLDFADRCEITVDDRDWLVAFPAVGDSLTLELGYREIGMAASGVFTIEEVVFSGPPRSITLTGSSVSLASTFASPNLASFEGKTLGEIVTSLGEAAGMGAQIHPDLARIAVPFVNMTTSPLALMGELARTFGAVAKVVDGRIVLAPRDGGVSAGGTAIPIVRLGPEHFGQWSVRHHSRLEHSEVQASYFDTDDNVRKWVSESPLGVAFSDLLPGSNPLQLGQMFASKGEAEAAARSKMQGLVRGSGQFSATLAAGDPWLRDQQRLQVAGMRDGVDGSYITGRVVHTYSDGGLQTQVEANAVGTGEDYAAITDLANFLIPLPGEPLGRLIIGSNGMIAGDV